VAVQQIVDTSEFKSPTLHASAGARFHDPSGKIPIALVINSLPPYRLHLHRRIVRELKSIRLWTALTHQDDARWEPTGDGDDIGLVQFSAGVACDEQGKHFRREWAAGGKLIEWAKRIHVQAVVLNGYNDAGRVRLLLWCWGNGIPCFLVGDSNINDDRLTNTGWKGLVKRVLLGGLLRFCSAVLPCGTAGRLYFQKYGVPEQKIFPSPYEPDYESIRNVSPEVIADVRREFGLVEGRRRLLFCGRVVSIKRADLAIDTFCAIAARRPSWDLVILGDGPLRQELQTRVPPELRGRMIWIGHTGRQERVSAVQRCCDVLLLPSDREPWAVVINEALAAGLAVVSSSIAGAAVDLVRDGINGRLFPVGDRSAFEECLLDVTDEHSLAGMQAQSQIVLEEWRRIADPVEGLSRALKSVGIHADRQVSILQPEAAKLRRA
jgi:glycosyltransferase involved in cell wall biosynthesis